MLLLLVVDHYHDVIGWKQIFQQATNERTLFACSIEKCQALRRLQEGELSISLYSKIVLLNLHTANE